MFCYRGRPDDTGFLELPQKPGNQVSTTLSPGAKPGILKHMPANRYLKNAHALVQIRDRGWRTAFIQGTKKIFNKLPKTYIPTILILADTHTG